MNMSVRVVVLLSTLFLQTSSAPSGCLESCNIFHQVNSYQTHHTSGSVNSHSDSAQEVTNLTNQNYLNFDHTKPDNWTEHNEYRTNNGHGKVYEEQGQYITGPKRVKYFKKNYTSSYNTDFAGSPELVNQERLNTHVTYDSGTRPHSEYFQRIYESKGSESYRQDHGHNRLQTDRLQPVYDRRESDSERLRNIEELKYSSQKIQQSTSGIGSQNFQIQDYNSETDHGNWSTVNSYRTDRGHGQVFEENGQYVTGPNKIRYYRRNYTSGYTTNNAPVSGTRLIGDQDLQREMLGLNREFDNFGQEIHQSTHSKQITASNTLNTNFPSLNQEIKESNARINGQNTQYNNINQGLLYVRPSDKVYDINRQSTHHETNTRTYQSHPNIQSQKISSDYIHVPTDERYQQRYTQNLRETEHNINTNYKMTPLHEHEYTYNQHRDIYPSRTEQIKHYQEHWTSSSQPKETSRIYINTNANNMQLAEEIRAQHERNQESEHVDCIQESEQIQHGYTKRYKRNIQHKELNDAIQQESKLKRLPLRMYDQEDFSQQNTHKPTQLVNENQHLDDFNQQSENLMQQNTGIFKDEQQIYQPYREGKFDIGSQQLDNVNQQSDDLSQKPGEFDDLTQQTTGKQEHQQQTYQSYSKPGRMEIGTQRLHHYNKQNEDETQQISGKLEFGQEVYYPHRSGNHEYNKQELESINQQNEDLQQQTDGFDDLTQQTAGKQEHQQQTYQSYSKPGRMEIGTQRLHHYNKQNEDETQQISGKFEFGQEVYYPHRSGNHEYNKRKLESINQQNENLQQQTDGFDDLTQQTGGKQEHQQQTYQSYSPGRVEIDTQDLHDYNKQNKDETQQTSSKLEFGQEVYYPYRSTDHEYSKQELEHIDLQNKDFIQQTDRINDSKEKNIGELEDLQQTYQSYKPEKVGIVNEQLHHYNKQNEDEIQQTSGKLELGQVYHPHTLEKDKFDKQKLEDIDQQNNVFMQEIGKHYDFTQQNNGKKADLQQTYQSYEPGKVEIGKEQLEHYNKQNEEKTQQTIGKFDFGGVSQSHRSKDLDFTKQELEDIKQQNEDLVQQTAGFHDFTPQTTGKLTHHQQSYELYGSERREINNQQLQHYGEQNKDEIQRTRGELEISNLDQELNYEQNNSDGVQQIANTNYGIPLYIPKLAPTPAPKPKPKLRYHERDQMQNNDTESNNNFYNYNYKYSELNNTNENTKNVHEPIEPNIDNMKYREIRRGDQEVRIPVSNNTNLSQQFQNNNNNINNTSNYTNQMNWAHRSNSNISDLNWYYTHHINNLTNNKNSQINSEQMSQQTQFSLPQSTYSQQPDVINYGQQQTRTNAGFIKNSYRHRNQQSNQTPYSYHVQQNNYEQQLGSFKRSEIQNSQHLSPIQDNDSDVKVEPRILEAYGAGPYDANHSDDIYSRVTLNPSVTLPPYVSGIDPWDIREKPKDAVTESSITVKPLTVETFDTFETTTQTETPPSIWLRFRHKLTNTFDKAKEKARDIFG